MDYRSRTGKYVKLPPDLKERYRIEYEKVRHVYETENLGSFELIYPVEDENLMMKYNNLLKYSATHFNEKNQYNLRNRKTTLNPQTSA